MGFNSDAIYGIPPGLPSPNMNSNPYAQGGPLFGQGYGDRRNVIFAPSPNAAPSFNQDGSIAGYHYSPPPVNNWNAPAAAPAPSYSAPPAQDLRSVGRAIQSMTGSLNNNTAPQYTASNVPTYTSGIDAGPVWSTDKVNQATAAIANQNPYLMPSISGVNPGSGTQNLLSLLAMGNAATDSNAFNRAAAQTNADQLYNSQTARANSGVQGGNLLARLNATNLTNQATYNNSIMSLIGSLLGMV